MLKKLAQGLGIGALAALLALGLWRAGWLDRLEWKTWDWRVAVLAQPSPATDRIRIVKLDQASLDWVKRELHYGWPWPRSLYAPIIAFCRRQGARAIVFDMLYTEPSVYTSIPDDDQTLGEAFGAAPDCAGAALLGQGSGEFDRWPDGVPARGPEIQGLTPWLFDVNRRTCVYLRATLPIPEVAHTAAFLGGVNADPDADAIIRRARLFALFDERVVPALGLAAYLIGQTNVAPAIAPGALRLGTRTVPIDREGQALLRYRGPEGTHASYSAAAVLQNELRWREIDACTNAAERARLMTSLTLATNLFRDRYVFFGCTAGGLKDLRPTPLDGEYPGTEIHATLLDNLLAGDFLRAAPAWLVALKVVVLALLWGVLTRLGRNATLNILVFLLALPLPALLSLAAYQRGVWLPFMPLEAATVFALVGAVLVNFSTEGRQKRFIRGAFKQYLSDEVVEQLVRHPERLALGGEQRLLTIFFSDLQGFTTISETLSPQALTTLLNEYLSAMTDVIQAEGGTIDKYEGDAIVAFWNAPLDQADHAARAVRAALRCQARLAELRPALRERTGKALFMRAGLHTGSAVVGNMGSRHRFNYTILGDAVNLAARLEGVNKAFGTFTLASEATRAAAGEAFAGREVSRVAVVGRTTPVTIYEPLTPEAYAARRPAYERFAAALAAYYAGRFEEAAGLFEPLAADDPPAAVYLRRCREHRAHPPATWEGVWAMTEK